MDFISNQRVQVDAMLAALKIRSVEELFCNIPKDLLLAGLQEDDGVSEFEGMALMQTIAAENTFQHLSCYLGGGAYEHHIPALVGFVCSKSEFLTSYTPYQPEASQGMLQAIFEYQSAICALTGMDVSNASLYDGASACAEALLMALRLNKGRNKVVVGRSVHPHYRAVIEQFLNNHATQIEWIPHNSEGRLDIEQAIRLIDEETAAVLVQSPNFFGVIEDVAAISTHAKSRGALTILSANPLAYGLYASAKELGVDIAVGDTQPFGLPMHFGGPFVGYLACKQELVRQLPGRLVGETVDQEGKRGFVLTLQAREQHIRREKATSNICTNQALAALASLVAILWYGKEGVRKLALTNFQRASYLKANLELIPGVKVMGHAPFFNEFAISFSRPFSEVEKHFRRHGIAAGIDLSDYYPEFEEYILIAVTETKNKRDLDKYIQTAQKLVKPEEEACRK
ncbi:MAG: aminomethyl-transferring glycine dehydrogenase subunit GcvPA [Parachlamydiaceae bacterium]